MRRWTLLLGALGLIACGTTKPAPMPIVPPGSRLIFSTGAEGLISVCDRGNRVYLSSQGSVAVALGACPDGAP